jgi:hypothetical protein
MIQGIGNLLSSVQMLNLSRGLYLVSVAAGSPQKLGEYGSLVLPAIHLGPGPGSLPGEMDFMFGPGQAGHWLYEARATMVVKVIAEQAVIVLTTLRGPSMPAVEIDVARLDRGPMGSFVAPAEPTSPSLPAPTPDIPPSVPPPLKTVSGQSAVSVRVDMHIQRKGDVSYTNTFWSGALGERCAIEGFAISPLVGLRPDEIEYSGVAENGEETGWVTDGALCGSRGQNLALSGFAIRIRSEAQARFYCEYRGAFASGRILGPSRNGAPCGAEAGDRLEAIQLFILPKEPPEAAFTPPPAAALPSRPIGPKFSVFRETAE